jgi:hypothetical protein
MSKRWEAKCWLGSKSGYVNLNVNASTRGGAEEQLRRTYGAEQIINLREVRGDSSSGGLSDVSASSGSVAVVALLAAFVFFTPWIMMLIYGAGSAWIAEKILGVSIQDYVDDDKPSEKETKKAMAVFLTCLICGGIGFIQGSYWQNSTSTQSTPAQVSPQK